MRFVFAATPTADLQFAGVVPIDPVSICLHLADVAVQLYEAAGRGSGERVAAAVYTLRMDLGTAPLLGRQIFHGDNLTTIQLRASVPCPCVCVDIVKPIQTIRYVQIVV